MKKMKRIMALLLVAAMFAALLPASVFALKTEPVTVWPAQSFFGSTGELFIQAKVGEGVFPEGTTMHVEPATKSQLDQVIAEEDAVDAIAADITFYDRGGNEIQPADGKTVEVTFTALRTVGGNTHETVTMDKNGNTETVGDATAVQSVFDAEHFTIYAIIGKDEEPALLTVNFYDQEGVLLSTQIVKNGDTLFEPEVPAEIDQKVFTGWYESNAETPFTGFGVVSDITETATLDLTAGYSSAAVHVIYHDQLGNVVSSIGVAPGSSVEVLPDSPIVKTTKDTQCHIGWATELNGTDNVVGTLPVGNEDINLYPIVKEGYWVTFDTDGGTAYNHQFVALDATGDEKKAQKPATDPYKEGYSFGGWYADEAYTEEFDFTQDITQSVTVYAKWIEDPDTIYIVEYYVEYQSDVASDTWDYKLVANEVRTAPKGSDAEYDAQKIFSAPYNYNASGYELNEEKTEQNVKVASDGSTVWKIYYQCKTFTITANIPSRDGTTVTVSLPAKYTADLGYYWDEVAKYQDLDYLFDGSHMFVFGPNSLFVDTPSVLSTMTFTYNLTNGTWSRRPGRTISQRIWLETLEGVAPEGKEALPNNSARQQLGTITDNRTYYLYETESGVDDINLLSHSRYNLFEGFTVWMPYSDGNYYLYTNEWYIFYHAGTRYASRVYGLTNEVGKNLYGYYPAGDSYESNAYWNDSDGYVDIYCYRNSYNLNFHESDGKICESFSIYYEKNLSGYDPTVTRPDEYTPGVSRKTNPDGQELIFEGWYTEQQLINKFDFTSTNMPHMDIDLYAKWVPITYSVTYQFENGDPDYEVKGIEYGDTVPQVEDPTYENHIFLGWSLNDRPYNFDSGISKDITLVAKWRSIEAYSVTYDLNGGSGTAPVDPNKYYEDSELVVLGANGVTAPEGKVFLGWKSDADDELYYANGLTTMPLGGLTLTAQWGDVDDTVDLIYDFNFGSIGYTGADAESSTISAIANNGNVKAAEYQTLNSDIPDGYTFKTWNTKADGSGKNAAPGDDIYVDSLGENRLYAIWEKNAEPEPEPEPEEILPAYTIVKATTSKAKDEDGKYTAGETITYKITVTNTGNITLSNIVVSDELTGDEWTIESLDPGDAKEFTTSYVVTEADAAAGKVVNVATGTAEDPRNPEPDPDDPDSEVPEYPPLEPEKPGTTEDPTKETDIEITPITVNVPPVIKELKGDDPSTDAEFRFTFTRDDASYPMPNGARGDTLTLSVTGAGQVEVGQIVFDQAGTYSYTVKEIDDKTTGYTYDTSVYRIVYEVSLDDSTKELIFKRTITKDGIPVEDQSRVSFVFTNTYTAPKPAPDPDTPKTGDDTTVLLWMLMLLSGSVLTGTFFAVRRRRRKG